MSNAGKPRSKVRITAAVCAPLVVVATVPASATGSERETATLIREDVLPHRPGTVLRVYRVVFPPRSAAARHHHSGSVTVIVLRGQILSQLEGEPAVTYSVGQSFFEPANVVHLRAENPSHDEEAEILAIHVDDVGAQSTVFHGPSSEE